MKAVNAILGRILLALTLLSPSLAMADERPNVIWIISDDLSPELGCYGYPDVATPNLDRLAASGARYTHAFSTAPVCSASRTAFQTGRYQTAVGGHHHDTRIKPVLPDSIPTVTGLMQEAGYFVSNGHGTAIAEKRLAKSHFNFVYDKREFFDGYDWSQRAEGQPFFAQVQIKEPHRVFVESSRAYPDAPIPPYYPNHPVTRADWADYLASIEVLDQKVGEILDRLDEEEVADNTLVMFFGDHGRPHVRGKQWLYDGGLHTPLIVRWPGKIKPGTVHDQLTSLLDLMPTTLAAAGIEGPDLPGLNLLDANWNGHQRLFAARDRCGEARDRIRSVRTQDFKYIRNFHPETAYLQLSSYKKLQYPVETLMKVLHAQGRWDSPLMATTRPKEELYDLSVDPYEMANLAADPAHAEILAEMRTAVDEWIEATGDQGAIDESKTVDMRALRAEKRKWYEKTMKARGLDPDVADRDYLEWWKKELGVEFDAAENMVSPDGNVSASLFSSEDGDLLYGVCFKNADIVEPSVLGITVDGIRLGQGVLLGEAETAVIDESYATRGNHTQARNHSNVWTFPVEHKASGRRYTLEFRVYDDGVAFRYVVPGDGVQHVDGESSSWKLVDGARAWYFERLTRGWKLKSYAGEWMSTDINDLHTATPVEIGPIQGTPLVLELPNGLGYAAVTKAALYDYSGMRLNAVGDRTVVANFTESEDGFDVDGTIVTPWRVTMLADDLNELVNSDLINNLNPAPDAELFADTSFIKPGRSVWSWETLGLDSPATQRTFIDLAAEMGFEYSTVDDGWKDWDAPWETIRSLCEHGRSSGVGVWVWVHSEDIRDPASDYEQMRGYFDRVAAAGAVGLKIDFMNGETKALVDFEIAALRIAAEHKLMINFHGCHASTGEERTWPNELTREGIRGMEVNKMREGPLPALHNAALPFTRFVVGQADYTPILYTNPGPTTWAHQLATLIAFTSPFQVYAEHPETMMKKPILRDACSVMESIPTVWDETIVLPGSKIGDLAGFARRSGDHWFVGILNGGKSREYALNLSFLPDGSYTAVQVSDDLDAERVSLVGLNQKASLKQYTTAVPFRVDSRSVTGSETLPIRLAEGGGFVAILTKK